MQPLRTLASPWFRQMCDHFFYQVKSAKAHTASSFLLPFDLVLRFYKALLFRPATVSFSLVYTTVTLPNVNAVWNQLWKFRSIIGGRFSTRCQL